MTEEPDTLPDPLWVFGYGSLIWNPGFPVAEKRKARLSEFHRSFCMSSIHHRGTEESPGLVLALDPAPGGQCTGVAFRVPDEEATATVEYLRERELISSAYVERVLNVEFEDGTEARALIYIVDTEHVQYVGGMELEAQAQIIARAVGGMGPNTEYLWNTVSHLGELGIRDKELEWLSDRVRDLASNP